MIKWVERVAVTNDPIELHILEALRSRQEKIDKLTANHPVMTVNEAAAFLRISTNTLYAEISAGRAPGKKIRGRIVLLREDLIEWVRSR